MFNLSFTISKFLLTLCNCFPPAQKFKALSATERFSANLVEQNLKIETYKITNNSID